MRSVCNNNNINNLATTRLLIKYFVFKKYRAISRRHVGNTITIIVNKRVVVEAHSRKYSRFETQSIARARRLKLKILNK